jgi:hypothetical protein
MHFEHVMSHQNPHEMRQNGYENTCREQGQAALPQTFDKIRTGRNPTPRPHAQSSSRVYDYLSAPTRDGWREPPC